VHGWIRVWFQKPFSKFLLPLASSVRVRERGLSHGEVLVPLDLPSLLPSEVVAYAANLF